MVATSNQRLLVSAALALLLTAVTGLAGGGGEADTPLLKIYVPDTVIPYEPGESRTFGLPVYFDNYQDTVAGLEVWLQLDRPDIVRFTVDSGLIQRSLPIIFDSAGTLCGGWEYLAVVSLAETGTDAKIVALANFQGGPVVPHMYPQTGGVLVYPHMFSLNLPAAPAEFNRVLVHINDEFSDATSFSDPYGQLIGWNPACDTVVDTAFFLCTAWDGDVCLSWERVVGPPADSIFVDTVVEGCLDTNLVVAVDGAVTMVMCGDVNGDGARNVTDLTTTVGWMFHGLPPEDVYIEVADVNGSGGTANVADLTYYVNYLFKGGSPLNCL